MSQDRGHAKSTGGTESQMQLQEHIRMKGLF